MALTLAFTRGNLEVVTALIAAGVDVNAANEVTCAGYIVICRRNLVFPSLYSLPARIYGNCMGIRTWSPDAGERVDSCRS
jgi:hypothetical protein